MGRASEARPAHAREALELVLQVVFMLLPLRMLILTTDAACNENLVDRALARSHGRAHRARKGRFAPPWRHTIGVYL